jgi:TonB family protein
MKLTISFLFLTVIIAHAQNDDPIIAYFDKNWVPTQHDNAYYFRTAAEQPDGRWLVRDYYMASLRVQMEASCTAINPKLEYEGKATWYYENGKVSREVFYKYNEKIGEERSFYEDGSPQDLLLHKGERTLHGQHWEENGKPVLTNGNGIITGKYLNGSLYFSEVVDSLLTAGYSISPETRDTVFNIVPESAEYKRGMMALYRGIAQDLKYPALARRVGIQGKVFVEFVIDTKGEVEYARVVRGIGGGCDEAAVEAFLQQKKWKPARYKGKPVKQKMVIPINFLLN